MRIPYEPRAPRSQSPGHRCKRGHRFGHGHRLAAEGVDLALVARGEARLSEARAHIAETHGVEVVQIVADLSLPDAPDRAVRQAADALGGIDILVNNAGSSPFGSLEAVGDGDWMSSIDLKLMGYVRCTRAVFGIMKEGGGGVIANVVGMAGRSASPAYVLGSLNAALLHFTKSVAELGGPHGIRVVAVNPGLTTTDRMEEAIEVWARDAGMTNEEFRPPTWTRGFHSVDSQRPRTWPKRSPTSAQTPPLLLPARQSSWTERPPAGCSDARTEPDPP